ncbi:MAG TPA: methionyl-tRNA formyltransferase [Phycisphaerales bacterium]|nr:methionyl-tRNA formyltransferase [Phycisphaerales bacterium]
MRVLFFGSGAFGVPSLSALLDRHEVVAVVSQPDRKAGRGSRLTPTPIATFIEDISPSIPIYKPEKLNTEPIRSEIRSIDADIWVVIAYGQKLGQKLLDGRFAVNLHASVLPRWRGAAPINAAILAGDEATGTSVIALAEEMDAGEIFATSTRPIAPDLTAGDLHDLLADDGIAPLLETIEQYESDSLQPITQDPALVTLAPKLTKADGVLDFSHRAEQCRNRIHGLNPWPGVTVLLDDHPIKLLRSQAIEGQGQETPGTIVDAEAGLVRCGSGLLRLTEVQPAGKKAMAWSSFVRGRDIQSGQRFEGR